MPSYRQQQEAIEIEQNKVKEKADRYDRLVSTPGFGDFLATMQAKVNAEIAEARRKPLEPEAQRVHIIRWNAMQEILDAGQDDINDTRKERDRLKNEELEYLRMMSFQDKEENINV